MPDELHHRHDSVHHNEINIEPLDIDTESHIEPESSKTVLLLAYIALWYLFSVSLSVYNKWMFSSRGPNFLFPLLTTALHQGVQYCLARIFISCLYIDRHDAFTWREYAKDVFPCGLASSMDIGMGNLSLKLISLSFYTMIKSSALAFVLLFSLVFKLEQPSLKLALIVLVISVGTSLMAFGEIKFSTIGFLLVLTASCSSGLRWALTKMLLIGRFDGHKPHPLRTITLLAPTMFVVLLIIGSAVEGVYNFSHASLWTTYTFPHACFLLFLPGMLAFAMTWAEFELLNLTSALTLAIAGICKEIVTIFVSVAVFGDQLTLVHFVGLVTTIGAVSYYHRYRSQQNQASYQAVGEE